MSRLSLVIADSDTCYLAEFEKFLMINYPQRFDIFSFSSPKAVSDFLDSSEKRDILLINSKIYKKEYQLKNIETVILLSDDSAKDRADGLDVLFKYRHSEKLVTDILRLYAARSVKASITSGYNNSRAVCVFSPSGGAGKTSIAAGCSIICARKGLKTFYLNMEDIPSTDLFFHSESEQSFSNVIFHLKGIANNLGLKLEGAKSCDSKSGVCFFAPPESVLEQEELTDHDVLNMMNALKESGIYDVVFIDMSCGLNKKNLNLLGCADTILLVLAPDDISGKKMEELAGAIEILEHKYGLQMSDHMVSVVNKCDERQNLDSSEFINIKMSVGIGECKVRKVNSHVKNPVEDLAFLSDLNKLLEIVLPKAAAAAPTVAGGELIA